MRMSSMVHRSSLTLPSRLFPRSVAVSASSASSRPLLLSAGTTAGSLLRQRVVVRCVSSQFTAAPNNNGLCRHRRSPPRPTSLRTRTRRRNSSNNSRSRRSTQLPCSISPVTGRSFSSSGNDEKDKDKDKNANDSSKTAVTTSSPSVLQGLGLSAATAVSGFSAAAYLSSATGLAGISGIPCSLLLGMLVRNTLLTRPDSTTVFLPGLTVATKTILQTGIVCVAAKLSVADVLATGTQSLPVVLSATTAGLLYIPLAGRAAGLPPSQSLLLAAGTSICGVTAITALAPAIHAPPRDVAVAVASTVAFGTLGMLLYPPLFHALCHDSVGVGMCLGVAVHDTSQVLGAALAYREAYGDAVAFEVAAVTKLLRNVGLAVVLPVLTYVHHRERGGAGEGGAGGGKGPETVSGLATFTKYVPPFLVAFIGMSAARSLGDVMIVPDIIGDVGSGSGSVDLFYCYSTAMDFIGNDLSKAALGTAMAGVGLSTQTSTLRGVGWKPFAVGGSGALVVGGTGFAVASAVTATIV